jgi:transcriptional regulator with XRE-family HTH domain
MGCYTYGDTPAGIVADVFDFMAMRQLLIAERGRREWTQEDVATRAGLRQGQISRFEDLSQELPDFAARVLFQIIEDGFGYKLSTFFQHLEEGTKPAEGLPLPVEQVDHAALASAGGLAQFEALGTAIGRSIVEQLERRDRERQDSPRPRKKPRRRKNTGSHSRRRV